MPVPGSVRKGRRAKPMNKFQGLSGNHLALPGTLRDRFCLADICAADVSEEVQEGGV